MAWKRIGADIRTAQGRWVLLLLQHLSSAENEHCHGKRARPTSEWESPNRQLSKQVGAAEHKSHRCRASGIRISRAIHRKHQRRSRQCIASPSRKRTNPGRSSHRSFLCRVHTVTSGKGKRRAWCVCASCVWVNSTEVRPARVFQFAHLPNACSSMPCRASPTAHAASSSA